MNFTRTENMRLMKIGAAILIVSLIVAYAIWRSFSYARGPEIVIFFPENGSTISSSTTEIRGQALRVQSISMNGSALTMDEQGNFIENLAVFDGLNRISFVGRDQFGREIRRELDIVGLKQQTAISEPIFATTTSSSTRQ